MLRVTVLTGLLLSVGGCGLLTAEHDISGTWQGQFETEDGRSIRLSLLIRDADGTLTGSVTTNLSRREARSGLTGTRNGNDVEIELGRTRFQGEVGSDGRRMEGEITGPFGREPLTLER